MSRLEDVIDRDHYVYRAFDAEDRLLYVGCSLNVKKRMSEHGRAKWRPLMARLDVVGPYSYHEARGIEWEAIQTEEPTHNGQTPKAVTLRFARRRFVDEFIEVAMAHGETFNDAIRQAVTAVDIELSEDEVA